MRKLDLVFLDFWIVLVKVEYFFRFLGRLGVKKVFVLMIDIGNDNEVLIVGDILWWCGIILLFINYFVNVMNFVMISYIDYLGILIVIIDRLVVVEIIIYKVL